MELVHDLFPYMNEAICLDESSSHLTSQTTRAVWVGRICTQSRSGHRLMNLVIGRLLVQTNLLSLVNKHTAGIIVHF